MPSPILALAFNRDILTRLNIGPRFQQLRIPPDMLVPLLFRQVEPVQVLRDLPKLALLTREHSC